ncbi:MAG: hypothetical protein O3B47_04940 [bacterium]|nr:hypothetical protein [bacterium]
MKKIRDYLYRNYLEDGEKILDTAHAHIIILKFSMAKPMFFGVIIPVLIYLIFPIPQVALVAGIWVLVGVYGLIMSFLDWYYDVWLITDQGVVSITRNGYFDMTTQRMDYHLIDDISYQVKGFLATMLNFGDITLDKLVARNAMVLKEAANPKRLERLISKYKEKYVTEKTMHDHNELKSLLAEMITSHASTNKK